jgi:hypothetical protein
MPSRSQVDTRQLSQPVHWSLGISPSSLGFTSALGLAQSPVPEGPVAPDLAKAGRQPRRQMAPKSRTPCCSWAGSGTATAAPAGLSGLLEWIDVAAVEWEPGSRMARRVRDGRCAG